MFQKLKRRNYLTLLLEANKAELPEENQENLVDYTKVNLNKHLSMDVSYKNTVIFMKVSSKKSL